VFNGEDIGLDVQELTESIENVNTKILNYWLCKLVQDVANKSGERISVALQYCLRLKTFFLSFPLKLFCFESNLGVALKALKTYPFIIML